MKRKLDDENRPEGSKDNLVTPAQAPSTVRNPDFSALSLESRLLQAVTKEGFTVPTTIQLKAIPLALEGKDILARSHTGSGKTAAYVLPIIHSILQRKREDASKKSISALILVPTRELAQQVTQAFSTFAQFCFEDVQSLNLTQKIPENVQRSLLAETPDVIIATPARAAQYIKSSALSPHKLAHLVIDEADLVLSYGYDDDLQAISRAIPNGLQTFLMSATLTAEVNTLKGLFCRNPVLLDIQDAVSGSGGVTQYVVKCAEDEKFLLIYVIFKLKLVKGKCIIFVGETDRCYRLKLFLEQFGIKSCVLNSELPVNSRVHVVQEFNKNMYDIIIAADEHEVFEKRKAMSSAGSKVTTIEEADLNENRDATGDSLDYNPNTTDQQNEPPDIVRKPDSDQRVKSRNSREYGVARGIDFQNVSCVLNFDLPTSSKSYTHRIGRTARAGKTGMALSFAVPAELYHKHPPTTLPSARYDEDVLDQITQSQKKKGREVKPYHFDMKQVDGFRYRMNDALRAVTRIAVREARTRELKQELLKSEKLKRHFEENPEDLQLLRHDNELRSVRVQHHLRHVPDYLMPRTGNQGSASDDIGFVGLRKTTDNRIRNARMQNRMKRKGKKSHVKGLDPLKTLNAKGRR